MIYYVHYESLWTISCDSEDSYIFNETTFLSDTEDGSGDQEGAEDRLDNTILQQMFEKDQYIEGEYTMFGLNQILQNVPIQEECPEIEVSNQAYNIEQPE